MPLERQPLSFWAAVEDGSALEEVDFYWRSKPGGTLAGSLSFEGAEAIQAVEDGLPAGTVEVSIEVVEPDSASGADSSVSSAANLPVTAQGGAAISHERAAPWSSCGPRETRLGPAPKIARWQRIHQ